MEPRSLERETDRVSAMLEQLPTQFYSWLVVGSILLSALLMLTGRWRAALFVGQWPPTIAILAVLYKQLRPSQEAERAQMRQAIREMQHPTG